MIGAVEEVLAHPQSGAAIVGACVGVLGSLLVAIATVLLNRGKYKRETLWDKRQSACNEIVSSLQASSRLAAAIREGFEEDAHSFYGSKGLHELNEKYEQKIASAQEAFQGSYLILPSRFRMRYERLERERDGWWYSAGPDVYLEQIAANERARRELFDLARSELGIIPLRQRAAIRVRQARVTCIEAARRWSRRRRRRRGTQTFDDTW